MTPDRPPRPKRAGAPGPAPAPEAIDPRKRFSKTAGDYHRHRPSYPRALIDWILDVSGVSQGAPVADVGCGTGIVTRLLAERGLAPIGIDPNDEMLALAHASGGRPCLRGEATATGLAAASVDLVTVGQAFHWFDVPKALAEFRRILTNAGWCAAFWNVRQSAPGFMEEYDALLRERSSEYALLGKPARTLQTLKAAAGVCDVREAEFAHLQRLDREGLLGRAHSSSYVIHGVADLAAFDRALYALFERHAREGALAFQYRTLGLCFRIAGARQDRP
jgi:SAM-dependent methyltransferase